LLAGAPTIDAQSSENAPAKKEEQAADMEYLNSHQISYNGDWTDDNWTGDDLPHAVRTVSISKFPIWYSEKSGS
jgi:hypothetical protein